MLAISPLSVSCTGIATSASGSTSRSAARSAVCVTIEATRKLRRVVPVARSRCARSERLCTGVPVVTSRGTAVAGVSVDSYVSKSEVSSERLMFDSLLRLSPSAAVEAVTHRRGWWATILHTRRRATAALPKVGWDVC